MGLLNRYEMRMDKDAIQKRNENRSETKRIRTRTIKSIGGG